MAREKAVCDSDDWFPDALRNGVLRDDVRSSRPVLQKTKAASCECSDGVVLEVDFA